MIGRNGAWWGVAFVILLFVSAAMVSLPTASEGGERIARFYAAHKQLILWQQVVAVLAVLPLLAFAASLSSWARSNGRPNRWLMPVAWLVALASVVTSLVPLAMVLMANLSPGLAHQLTVVEDIADAALFGSLAAFVVAASTGAPVWVRAPAFLVAIAAVARAIMSPVGVTALDFVAPMAVLVFVVLLAARLFFSQSPRHRAAEAVP
jgi:hypothetical protein